MKNLIFLVTINITLVFFAIYAIFGKVYEGKTESFAYLIVNLIIVSISLCYIFYKHFLRNAPSLRGINLFFYFIPILCIILYLIESPDRQVSHRYFVNFLAFSAPSIYIGTYIASTKSLKYMAKWWDFIPNIVTLGLLFSFNKIIFDREVTLGGLSYQSISYFAAFAFSFNLFSLLFGKKFSRFTFFKSVTYKFVSYTSAFLQLSFIFISGGRGGFVVLFISTSLFLYLKFKENHFEKLLWSLIISIVLGFIIVFNFLTQDMLIIMEAGYERIFSYISSEGIDMGKTSGRDYLYSKMWAYIDQKTVFGYGIFKYADITNGYPHNIFMEMLLQGGIVYLLFWFLVFGVFINKIKLMIKRDQNNLLLLPIIIYPFTLLLFSGSYLMTSLFWFSIAYVFNYRIKKYQTF